MILAMSLNISPRIRLAALLGGAVYFVIGAIQATHGDFGGTHNTIDSAAEYVVTGGLTVSLLLTAPVYRAFGELAGRPRAALVAIVPQVVIALMCVISVARGEDPSFFNTVAPLCLLAWLAASVVVARGLGRTPLSVALVLLVPVTFALSPIGGPLLTGAFFMAVGAGRLPLRRAAAVSA
jgi:hypothetical protein